MKNVLHVGWQLCEENVVAKVLRHMSHRDRPDLQHVRDDDDDGDGDDDGEGNGDDEERTAGLVTIAAQGILLGRPVSHSIKEDWMKAWERKMNMF